MKISPLTNQRYWFVVIHLIVCSASVASAPGFSLANDEEFDFNRDIRPILSDTCFKCHGPDAADRQADLRLDTKQGLEDAADLLAAGDAENSEVYRRIMSDDEGEVMPPVDSGRILTAEQKSLLKQWIDSGANWQNHWSFEAPQKPDVPQANDQGWAKNEIDRFILRKLSELELTPNGQADQNTLIRRVSLDLIGLPPSAEILEKYSGATQSDWYERLVEELLASRHYGEHMARFWLDAARYADTHGLHLDNYREMWLYRDWVIEAFNRNLSYRDFVIEQLAGDLLENPTEDQLIATGFNRAHVTTNEGGSIVEEVLVRNVVDRVSTTGTVFMGLTLGCAQCHDHKYDPISQKDFYSLYAFFNSLDGKAMDGNIKDHPPVLRYFDEEQKAQMANWKSQQETLTKKINQTIADFANAYQDPGSESAVALTEPSDFIWVDDELPKGVRKTGKWKKSKDKSVQAFSGKNSFVDSNDQFSQIVLENAKPRLRFRSKDSFFVHVYLDPEKTPKQIMVQFNDGSWEHRAYWGDNLITFGTDKTPSRLRLGDIPEPGKWHRLEIKAESVGFKDVSSIHGIAFSQHGGKAHWDAAGVATNIPQSYSGKSYQGWLSFQKQIDAVDLPKHLRDQFKKDSTTEKFKTESLDYFFRNVHADSKSQITKDIEEQGKLKKQIDDATKRAPTTLIWKEKKQPSDAYVLIRGEYTQKGDKVVRATPDSLPEFTDDLTKDRLGLAMWLVSDRHPLTSRVAVNRFWQQFFGVGMVATSEDFGSQGELPSHAELLDWLAVDFRENGWDVKRLVKKMVMSATYRQSSQANSQKIKADDANRYYSRGPRHRLDAESLRDQALAVSGILIPTIGGPAVKPPQPDGLWYAVGYSGSNTVRFKKDSGLDKVHRRSLYTFWKRTAPAPQMSILDAPSRESCLVRRERTNTPLQALLLMNDPQFVEACRYFGQLVIDKKLENDVAIVDFMFRRAMSSDPTTQQRQVLMENLALCREEFKSKPEAAKKLVAIGEIPADEKYEPVELAALTMLANLIMNQDEFITKN